MRTSIRTDLLRTHDKIQAEVAEILRQAAEADHHEDQLFGDARGGVTVTGAVASAVGEARGPSPEAPECLGDRHRHGGASFCNGPLSEGIARG
jgi:hypothetical protein